MAGEIVTIFIGQTGIHLSQCLWELICAEHRIDCSGQEMGAPTISSIGDQTFFIEYKIQRFKALAIMIDLDSAAIFRLRNWNYNQILLPNSFCYVKNDASCNFMIGQASGRQLLSRIEETIARVCELCCDLKGFIVFRSIAGGTGSGVTPLVLEHLASCYSKLPIMTIDVNSSGQFSPMICQPYNAVLTTHASSEIRDCCFLTDNSVLFNIYRRRLQYRSQDHKIMNQVLSHFISNITVTFRLKGNINSTFEELIRNLITYPRIKYPIISYSPIVSRPESLNLKKNLNELIDECFEENSQLSECNPSTGASANGFILFRGGITKEEICETMSGLRGNRNLKFTRWSPVNFSIGTCEYSKAPTDHQVQQSDRISVILSNNSAIKVSWKNILSQFDRLYTKKFYVHHYLNEGLDESAFHDAYENIQNIIENYEQLERN